MPYIHDNHHRRSIKIHTTHIRPTFAAFLPGPSAVAPVHRAHASAAVLLRVPAQDGNFSSAPPPAALVADLALLSPARARTAQQQQQLGRGYFLPPCS